MKKIIGLIVLSLVMGSSAFAQKRSLSPLKLKPTMTKTIGGKTKTWDSQTANAAEINRVRAGVGADGKAIKSKIDTGRH